MKISERALERLVVLVTYSGLSLIAVVRGQYEVATAWLGALATYVMARRNGSMDRGDKEG